MTQPNRPPTVDDLHETGWAKVNLTLHVTGRRADGYHLLDSLVVFADCGDRVTLRRDDAPGLRIEGRFAGQLAATPQTDNLVTRAAAAFGSAGSLTGLTLTKNLPVAAGIGGGSADAAATLRLLARHFHVPMPAVAAELGADVPACLDSVPCILRGKGEQLAEVRQFPDFHLVLVNDLVPLSTAKVFAALQTRNGLPQDAPPADGAPDSWLHHLRRQRNDLQAVAERLHPGIARVQDLLASQPDCLLARMSGSGGTCFGLFAARQPAEAAARHLAASQPHWWVMATRIRRGSDGALAPAARSGGSF